MYCGLVYLHCKTIMYSMLQQHWSIIGLFFISLMNSAIKKYTQHSRTRAKMDSDVLGEWTWHAVVELWSKHMSKLKAASQLDLLEQKTC